MLKNIGKKIFGITIAAVMTFTMTAFAEEKAEVTGAVEGDREETAAEESYELADISTLPAQINIALFGLSADSEYDTNRTDSIIIVTIDNEHKQLKFTSILRDSKVPIEGHEPQKINAAYRYGGPDLALQTINENFHIELEDYITVNFEQFAKMVWLLGGVDIELSQAEVEWMEEFAPGYDYVVGMNHLDGWQALQYSRIRKIDSDSVRAQRQQAVLTELLGNVMELSLSDFVSMVTSFLDVVEATSLNIMDVITLATIPYSEYDIIYNRFPDADKELDLWGGIDDDHGEWVWIYDLDQAADRMNDIIYNEQPVQE